MLARNTALRNMIIPATDDNIVPRGPNLYWDHQAGRLVATTTELERLSQEASSEVTSGLLILGNLWRMRG